MQIVYHIGAHSTDDDRLLKSLLKNADALREQGTRVPGPGTYRNLLRETIQGLKGAKPAPDTRDILLDAILDDDHANRLVLSNENFICVVKRIFENQLFYHLIDEKVGGMRNLFPEDEINYFMGMRNPATFIPAVFARQSDLDYAAFMRKSDPRAMRWSDVVARIQRADPDAHLTVWCDEDTPLFWAQLIRDIAGIDAMARISGGFDLLQALLTEEGMKKFVTYLRQNPPQTEVQKRRIIAAFLERFAREDVLDVEIDLPGWNQSLVDELTALYHQDVEQIAAMPGVTLITP